MQFSSATKGIFVRVVLGVVFVAAVAIGTPFTMRAIVVEHLYTAATDVPSANIALVPGASVVRGEPSSILAQRLDAAIALYRAQRVETILVTGDGGGQYDEITPALRYLGVHDIPPDRVFFDRAGLDTYSSMYRAFYAFGTSSIIVVTQDFHLPRAVFLARSLGFDAHGLVAGNGGKFRDYLREIPASVKAVSDIILSRQVPVSGIPLISAGATSTAS